MEALLNPTEREIDAPCRVELDIVDTRFELRDATSITLQLFLQGGALGAALLFALVERVESGGESHQVIGEDAGFRIPHNGLNRLGLLGDFCLPAQRFELATNFSREIVQAGEVCLHRLELARGLLFASAVFEDSSRFLDEASAVFGARVQNLVKLSLTDNDVHFSTQATIAQELLNIEESTGLLVDGVFAPTVAKQGSRDGDFAVLDGEGTIRVVDGEGDLCATERRFIRGPREDDILHGSTAQGFRTLLPHDPSECVDNVRFSRTIGPHDTGDAGFELECGGLGKRLESLEGEGLQMHLPTALSGPLSRVCCYYPQTYRFRGVLWQEGHRWEDLFMKGSRRIIAPHRSHGVPCLP